MEAEQQAQARAAVAAERARVARELHDVIAHSVSVMVIQAGAAEQLLEQTPERARAPLEAVQDTGRQTIVALCRLPGILREVEGPALAAYRIQPDIEVVGEAVDSVAAVELARQLRPDSDASSSARHPWGREWPRRLGFARLMHWRGRAFGRLTAGAAFGGNLSLIW